MDFETYMKEKEKGSVHKKSTSFEAYCAKLEANKNETAQVGLSITAPDSYVDKAKNSVSSLLSNDGKTWKGTNTHIQTISDIDDAIDRVKQSLSEVEKNENLGFAQSAMLRSGLLKQVKELEHAKDEVFSSNEKMASFKSQNNLNRQIKAAEDEEKYSNYDIEDAKKKLDALKKESGYTKGGFLDSFRNDYRAIGVPEDKNKEIAQLQSDINHAYAYQKTLKAAASLQEKREFLEAYDFVANRKKLDDLETAYKKSEQAYLSAKNNPYSPTHTDVQSLQAQFSKAKTAYEEQKTSYEEAETYKKKKTYNQLRNNSDFGTLAYQIDSGELKKHDGMTAYGIINDSNIRKMAEEEHKKAYKTNLYLDANGKYAYVTSDQRDIYNYLFNKKGEKAASQYLEDIDEDIMQQRADALMEQKKAEASVRPVLSSVKSVADNLFSGVGYTENLLIQIGNKLGYTDKKLQTNSDAQLIAKQVDTVRHTVAETYASKWMGDFQIFGENAGSMLYQTIMSMADCAISMAVGSLLFGGASAVTSATGLFSKYQAAVKASEPFTLALMGTQAASRGVTDALQRGLSNDQSIAIGTLSGLAEIVTEKVSIEALLGNPDNVIPYLAKNFFSEGSEEVASDMINLFADMIISGDQAQMKEDVLDYKNMGYSEAEAWGNAIADQARQSGLSFLGGAISGLAFGGAGVLSNTAINAAANTYTPSQKEAVGNSILTAGIAEDVQKTLGTNNQKLSDKFGAAAAKATAENITLKQKAAAQKKLGSAFLKAVKNGLLPEDMVLQVAQSVDTPSKVVGKYILAENKADHVIHAGITADNIALSHAAQEVKSDPSAANLGRLYQMEINAGIAPQIDASEVSSVSEKMNISPEAREAMKNAYDGADSIAYVSEFRSVYQIAKSGAPSSTVSKLYRQVTGDTLTARQVKAAFDAGHADYVKNTQSEQQTLNNSKSSKSEWKNGTVTTDSSIRWNDLTQRQTDAISALTTLSYETGFSIELFQSEKTENRTKENGSYDPKTNVIRIDIDAWITGKNGTAAIMNVASHEITHAIKRWSPEKFAELQTFVQDRVEQMDGGKTLAELILEQQMIYRKSESYQKSGIDMSEEEATEEIVANACEKMLQDGSAMQELYQNHRTLWDKIKDIFKDFIDKLRAAYDGIGPKTREAQLMEPYLDQMQKLWNAAFVDAVETMQATENSDLQSTANEEQKNTDTNDGVKYSLVPHAKEEIENALADKQYRKEIKLSENSPRILQGQKGVKNLPLFMKASHIRQNILTEKEAKEKGLKIGEENHYHGLGKELFYKIIDNMDEITEAYRGTKAANKTERRENYFLLISTLQDRDGNTVNVPIYVNEKVNHNGAYIDANKVATAYGNSRLREQIKSQIQSGNLVRIKTRSDQTSEWTPLADADYGMNASGTKITQSTPGVNTNISDSSQNDASPVKNSPRVETAEVDTDTAKKVERLENQIKDLKLRVSNAESIRPAGKQLRAFCKKLVKDYGSSMNSEELGNQIVRQVFSYLAKDKEANFPTVMDRCHQIAGNLLDQVRNSTLRDQYSQDVIDTLKKTTFYLSEAQKNEAIYAYGTLKDYVRSIYGSAGYRMKETASMSLDQAWQEWAEQYPDLFDRSVPDVDQPMELAKIVDRMKNSGVEAFRQQRSELTRQISAEIYEEYFNMATESILIAEEKAKSAEQIRKMRTEFEQEKATMVREIKSMNAQKMVDMRKSAVNERREAIRKYAEQRKITELKNHIAATSVYFQKEALRTKDKINTPVSLYKAIIEVASAIDTTGRKMNTISNEKKERIRRALDNLRAVYDKIPAAKESEISSVYQQSVSAQLGSLVREIDNTPLRTMSVSQLETVDKSLQIIRNLIRDARVQIGKQERYENYALAEQIMQQQQQMDRGSIAAVRSLDNGISAKFINPMRFVRRICGYSSGVLVDLFDDFEAGQAKADRYTMEANKMFEPLRTDKENIAAYRKAQSEMIPLSSWKDINGKQVRMTKMQMMQIFMSWVREITNGETQHLQKGGVTLLDPSAFKMSLQGRKEAARKALSKAMAEDSVRVLNINHEMISELQSHFNKWDQEYMKVAKKLFDEKSKNAIDETSMILYHQKTATQDNYISFEVDKNYIIGCELDGVKMDATIEGMGVLKSVKKGASNPLIISGLDSIIDRSIKSTAKIYGLAIPVRNFNKVWGINAQGETDSVKNAIQRNWGQEGVKAIEQAVTDMQADRKGDGSKIINFMMSGFVKSALLVNPSVAIKQAASYFNAGAELSSKALAKGLAKEGWIATHMKDAYEEIDSHTAELWKRRIGMSSDELAYVAEHKNALESKADQLPTAINPYKWIQGMDVITCTTLWYAAKAEVEDGGISPSDNHYWQSVTQAYERTIRNTQPMYDVLHRTEVQKTTNTLLKATFAMFKTQPLQNFGMLYDSVGELRYAKKNGDTVSVKKAAMRVTKSGTSLAVSTLVFVAMTVFAKALIHRMKPYKDKDINEFTWESFLAQVGKDYGSTIMGSLVPALGSEIWSLIMSLASGDTYYDMSVPTTDVLNDFTTAITRAQNSPSVSSVTEVAYAICSLFGIPAKNASRLVEGIVNHIKDMVNGDFLQFKAGDEVKDSARYNRLVKDVSSGDMKKYNMERQELIASGKTEKEVDTGMVAALYKADARCKEAASKKLNGDLDGFSKIVVSIASDGYGSEIAKRACLRAYNEIAPENAKEESDKNDVGSDLKDTEYHYDSSELIDALEEKGGDAQSIVAELIAEKIVTYEEDGKYPDEEEKHAMSSVRSSLSSHYKPLYQKAYLSGDSKTCSKIADQLNDLDIGFQDETFEKWEEDAEKKEP